MTSSSHSQCLYRDLIFLDQSSWWNILSKHSFGVCRGRWFSPSRILSSFPSALMSQYLSPSRHLKKEEGMWFSNSLNSCQDIYEEGRVNGGRKWLRHRKRSFFFFFFFLKNIQSENCLRTLDFMNCINKESSHVRSEPLTLPSQLVLRRKCQIWRSRTWSIWVK